MKSWAVVCDVYYMEPQTIQSNETPIEFAARIKVQSFLITLLTFLQKMICERANLKNVDWDGYMKYYVPSEKLVLAKQENFASAIRRKLEDTKKSKDPFLKP